MLKIRSFISFSKLRSRRYSTDKSSIKYVCFCPHGANSTVETFLDDICLEPAFVICEPLSLSGRTFHFFYGEPVLCSAWSHCRQFLRSQYMVVTILYNFFIDWYSCTGSLTHEAYSHGPRDTQSGFWVWGNQDPVYRVTVSEEGRQSGGYHISWNLSQKSFFASKTWFRYEGTSQMLWGKVRLNNVAIYYVYYVYEDEAKQNGSHDIWHEISVLTSGSKLALNDHLPFMPIFLWQLGWPLKTSSSVFHFCLWDALALLHDDLFMYKHIQRHKAMWQHSYVHALWHS